MKRAFFSPDVAFPKRFLTRKISRLRSVSEGSALVETALVMPIVLTAITGILIFGVFIMQYMGLTEGVSNAGRHLAVSAGQTTDPCALAASSVQAAAPILSPSHLTYSVTMTPPGGSAETYAESSCSGSSTTSGPPSYLVSGGTVKVQATYSSCSLAFYGTNLMPKGCSLTSEITEQVQ